MASAGDTAARVQMASIMGGGVPSGATQHLQVGQIRRRIQAQPFKVGFGVERHQMVAGCGNKILLNKSHVGTSCGWWWSGRLREVYRQGCDTYASTSQCHHFLIV